MPSCCRPCDHRHEALDTPSTPSLLDVCLVTFTFMTPILVLNSTAPPYVALNSFLNDITDAEDSTAHPSSFTLWSPCQLNAHSAIILTTASQTCSSTTSPVFAPLLSHLANPPSVQHILLDYSITSVASSTISPESHVPIDIITISAPTPGIASVIGKQFGWDPKRSSLSLQIGSEVGAGFSHPGDLIRDFWAWAELPAPPYTPSTPKSMSVGSLGSVGEYEAEGWGARGVLRSTNSDEKNMALYQPEDDDDNDDDDEVGGVKEGHTCDDETLIMLFQWNSHADAERFKHPSQKSIGRNGQTVSSDLWERHVAHPVRQLEGIGARVEKFRLDLRGVEPRLEVRSGSGSAGLTVSERSGSRRLSVMATGLGERVSGLWK